MTNEPVAGHERQFAHVDFLLLHFLDDRLGRRFLVQDDQAHFRTQGRRERQATLLAFLDVERRVAEHVGEELEARKTIVRHDREDGGESGLQTVVLRADGMTSSCKKL
jgi:hypothetical protein